MDYLKMFGMYDSSSGENPYQRPNQYTGPSAYEPTLNDPPPMRSWEEAFNGFKSSPVLYNMDGFISPYASSNWGGTSNILQYIDDSAKNPMLENKIDPNRIFSSEINGLRALAADQQRITKLFEKRLTESLNEKGKMGLTEEDITAMSALTTARSAITAISKEQAAIKKSIAELKIKQAQNTGTGTGNGSARGSDGGSMNSMGIGRSILDSIFDAPSVPVTPPSTVVNYNPTTAGEAGRVIDSIVPTVGSHLQFESAEPTTYVVIGETEDDIDFVTYSSNGEIIPDFPKPNARITDIDIDAGKAKDEFLVEYPIKRGI